MQAYSKHFDLKQLSDGIYAAIATDGGYAVSNSGLIDLGDKTVLFDSTLNQQAARDLGEIAKSLFGREVDYVVNSHHHNDHIWGNQIFEAKSKIISSKKTRDLISTLGKEEASEDRQHVSKQIEGLKSQLDPNAFDYNAVRSYFESIEDSFNILKLVEPDVTFEDEVKIKGSKRSAIIKAYNGGHTASDSIAYIPESKIAFLGDLLFSEFHPWFLDGDPQRVTEILTEIQSTFTIEMAVPGHGPEGGTMEFLSMLDYLSDVSSIVEESMNKKFTLEETIRIPVPSKYKSWKFERFFKQNLTFLFKKGASTI